MAKSGKEPDIGDWRNRIDALDLELLRMLNERARCAIEIGKIKRKRNMPIYDPKREEQIIATALSHNDGPLDGEGAVHRHRRALPAQAVFLDILLPRK